MPNQKLSKDESLLRKLRAPLVGFAVLIAGSLLVLSLTQTPDNANGRESLLLALMPLFMLILGLIFAPLLSEKVQDVTSSLSKSNNDLRKQLKEIKLFKQAVESATDGISITDPDGVILYVNQAWEKMTGYTLSEAEGKPSNILRSDKTSHRVFRKMWKAIKAGRTFMTEEIVNKRKNGSEYQAQLEIYPVHSESGALFLVSLQQDITARKETERAKSEFVSIASHQLRSPLIAMKWLCDLLAKDKLSKEQTKNVQSLKKLNSRLIVLVDALLNVSRIELGQFKINIEEFDLIEMIDSILEEFEAQKKTKKLQLIKKAGAKKRIMKSDMKAVHMVIQNLISNAVKYTPNKGKVTISLSLKKKGVKVCHKKLREPYYLIEVSDTGYGIPQQQQSQVFEKLFRADNVREQNIEGTGLGLFCVKKVVESLNGCIAFESKEGEGTTFSILLPVESKRSNHNHHG